MSNFFTAVCVSVATAGGLGRAPVASGTIGSVPGVVFALVMASWGTAWQLAAALGLCLLAVPVCDVAEQAFGTKDDRRIVADEYLTFPLCVVGLPLLEHLWLLPVAFVVNRVLDITKPFPARQVQVLRGGIGIVLDDVFSCGYALAVNHALWAAARMYLER